MSNPETEPEEPIEISDEQLVHPADLPSHGEELQPEADEFCDADAFMDEEDSEAVAERLRQLGYI